MARIRSRCRPAGREGVILLVEISLLVLFSLVGIAFVVYAEGQANTARIWREGESAQQPDMDPELLLAYFLGELIYDTDNPHSALRGHGLARNMYGKPGSYVPFNGTGRLHTGGADDFYQPDYTAYPWNAGRNPDQYGSPNPPYTYPDFNHMYLAAQKASTGEILIPSYVRQGPNGPVTLRPSTAYHTQFPPQASPSGDVKNLADSPGYRLGPNVVGPFDSVWIDIGFPVMTAPDGRQFKPLFAPLVLDLDNRLNVNVHGNIRGSTNGNVAGGLDPRQGRSLSDQGLGPWEVNPKWVLPATDGLDPGTAGPHGEYRRLFIGDLSSTWNQTLPGRYDIKNTPTNGPWGQDWHRLPEKYASKGPFYSPINGDANFPAMGVQLPGFGAPPTSAFPNYTGNFDGWAFGSACRNHPLLYNFFMPANSYYYPGAQDRHFAVSNMEALLRYSDEGSPALTSQLFVVCPQSFGSAATGPKARRLCTTHAFDVDQPGVVPWLTGAAAGNPLALAAGAPYPTGAALSFPAVGGAPGGEFSPAWQATAAAMFSRINLNRDLPKGSLPWYCGLPGFGPPNFPAALSMGRLANPADFDTATTARQQFASELFLCLRTITGAADPATATPGTPEYDALRWLAQLCVNVVDQVDTDDCLTAFNWNPAYANDAKKGWVFGTELPRLVVKQAYMEVASDPADTTNNKVRCWVELLNPFYAGAGPGGQGGTMPLTEDAKARFWVPAGAGGPGYAAYRVVIATNDPTLRKADNVTGEPDPMKIKAVVNDYTPDPMAAPPTLTGDDLNLVKPLGAATSAPNGSNQGMLLLGPKDDFPGTDPAKPQASIRVKDNGQPAGPGRSAMVYDYPKTNPAGNIEKHTILLQRLACPYMPPQPNAGQPRYNPYVTVDYIEDVPVNDATAGGAVDQRYSVGRNQPYAAHKSQQVSQKPLTALTNQPQQTFFKINVQATDPATGKGKTDPPNTSFPYDWLTQADRPLISPVELLMTSAYKPHELTQQFMLGAPDPVTGKPTQKFQHLAPWLDNNARIYRLFEFLAATSPMQWVPTGGRTVGRVNINTIWDQEVFNAVADKTPNNFFAQTDVDAFFANMVTSRSPTGRPWLNDRPFRGMAVGYTNPGDTQYPQFGSGLEDTLLRPDPADPNPNPMLKRRLFEPAALPPAAAGHPYFRYEFLKKVFNNFTTRSNVFAVWVTVGFFEVVGPGSGGGPPLLGQEIGRAQNKHVRHRMFAIVDRTNVTIAFDPATGGLIPGQPGPRPFFLPSHTRVDGAGLKTIDVPGISGVYELNPWSIKAGDWLVVDSGMNQEVVQVTAVNAAPPQITAVFAKPHVSRFSISNAVLGNPGPQPRFDMRQPSSQGVVRFFRIVE